MCLVGIDDDLVWYQKLVLGEGRWGGGGEVVGQREMDQKLGIHFTQSKRGREDPRDTEGGGGGGVAWRQNCTPEAKRGEMVYEPRDTTYEYRCCYITVDSAMAALQKGFCSYKLSIHKKTYTTQIMIKKYYIFFKFNLLL